MISLRPRDLWRRIADPVDPLLFSLLAVLLIYALMALASATNGQAGRLNNQLFNLGLAFCVMWAVAQVPPQRLMGLALPIYLGGVLLLIAVALFGDVAKGAQRWLNLGFMRIQPSEIMKIAMPLMLAWYFQKHEATLRWKEYAVAACILAIPVGLIAKQPDLGTAILVFASGFFVIFLAGLSWKLMLPVVVSGIVGIGALIAFEGQICQPDVKWPVLKDYQKHRVCTLLDPSSDPLGKGFHTIQSTIAVGSGGVLGKGWFNGSQTHLDFLPERHTDFIFAVMSEEFGLVGNAFLLVLYLLFIGRGLVIAANGATLFSRLLAGSISLIFFTYAFVNMGMVSGILPVVGVPLPFASYGGTALVTLMLGVGILMSINKHRMLVQK